MTHDQRNQQVSTQYNAAGNIIINTASSLGLALHQLRAPVADFIGREQEIDKLAQALSKPSGGAATISGVRGMGGIGKTELGYIIANQLKDIFPDAQIIVELRGATNPLSPEQTLQTIIRSFTNEIYLPNDLAQLKGMYQSILNNKRVFILGDDAYDARQVSPLLPPPGCALLVTSRNRFSLPGMTIVDLGILSPVNAEKFLLEMCPRIGAYAGQLANLCGYLPLALRVSASLLANNDALRVDHFLKSLVDERTRLVKLRDVFDPDLDVEASLRISYNALDTAAQELLCQLGVFVKGFTQLGVKAVAAVEGDIEALLGQLRLRSMVDWDEENGCYRLHDLVRALVSTYSEDKRQVVQSRYLSWVIRNAKANYLQNFTSDRNEGKLDRRRQAYRASLDELFIALAPSLKQNAYNILSHIARQPRKQVLEEVIESLVLNLFTQIVIMMPQIDDSDNTDLLSIIRELSFATAQNMSELL